MLKPLLPAVSEFVYAGVLQAFGLEKLTGPERVKALLNVPVEDILKLPPTLPFLPVVDQDLIPEPFTFSQIAGIYMKLCFFFVSFFLFFFGNI